MPDTNSKMNKFFESIWLAIISFKVLDIEDQSYFLLEVKKKSKKLGADGNFINSINIKGLFTNYVTL